MNTENIKKSVNILAKLSEIDNALKSGDKKKAKCLYDEFMKQSEEIQSQIQNSGEESFVEEFDIKGCAKLIHDKKAETIKIKVSDSYLEYITRNLEKTASFDMSGSLVQDGEHYSISNSSNNADEFEFTFIDAGFGKVSEKGQLKIVRNGQVYGTYKSSYDDYYKIAQRLIFSRIEDFGWYFDKKTGAWYKQSFKNRKKAEAVVQNIFFDTVDEMQEYMKKNKPEEDKKDDKVDNGLPNADEELPVGDGEDLAMSDIDDSDSTAPTSDSASGDSKSLPEQREDQAKESGKVDNEVEKVADEESNSGDVHIPSIDELSKKWFDKKDSLKNIPSLKGLDSIDSMKEFIQNQIALGRSIEKEHTNDDKKAEGIAAQHINEFLDYYIRLNKMEDEAKKEMGEQVESNYDKQPLKEMASKKIKSWTKDIKESFVKKYALHEWTYPENYAGEDWSDYYAIAGRSRDSDNLENSNFETALKMLGGEHEPEVVVARSNHWLVGWVEELLVLKTAKDKVEIAKDIENKIGEYPILDEQDYSNREMESYNLWFEENVDEYIRDNYDFVDLDSLSEEDKQKLYDLIRDYSRYEEIGSIVTNDQEVRKQWSHIKSEEQLGETPELPGINSNKIATSIQSGDAYVKRFVDRDVYEQDEEFQNILKSSIDEYEKHVRLSERVREIVRELPDNESNGVQIKSVDWDDIEVSAMDIQRIMDNHNTSKEGSDNDFGNGEEFHTSLDNDDKDASKKVAGKYFIIKRNRDQFNGMGKWVTEDADDEVEVGIDSEADFDVDTIDDMNKLLDDIEGEGRDVENKVVFVKNASSSTKCPICNGKLVDIVSPANTVFVYKMCEPCGHLVKTDKKTKQVGNENTEIGDNVRVAKKKVLATNDIEADFKNQTLQTTDIDKGLVKAIREKQDKIRVDDADSLNSDEDDDDGSWVDGGLQKLLHTTILYGVESEDKEKIKSIVDKYVKDGIKVSNEQEIKYFDNEATCAYVHVVGEGLTKLHDELKATVKNKDEHPKYIGHIAIAYLKKGARLGDNYLDKFEWTINSVEMTNKKGEPELISGEIKKEEAIPWGEQVRADDPPFNRGYVS